jgi:hypothetical protein
MSRPDHLILLVAAVWLAFSSAGLAAERWAVVTAAGALARGSGALSSTKAAAGSYTVVFNARISGCTYQATIGSSAPPRLPNGRPVGGMISVAPHFSNPSALRVFTRDAMGAPKSRGFHLLVACPPARLGAAESTAGSGATRLRLSDVDRWAVVSFDQVYASRGAVSAAFIPLATGNSGTEVLFGKEVRLCGYLASEVIPQSEHDPYLLGVGPRRGKSKGVHVSSALTSTSGFAGEFNLIVKCPGSATRTVNDRWAVVNANGTLVRGYGALASVRLGTGRYAVSIDKRRFGWPVAGRAALVTIGTGSGALPLQPLAGAASFELWGEVTDTSINFVVETWKPNPDDPDDLIWADRPFHLYVAGY